ncbi:hypothetical protein Tco_1154367 [Tanacetum coccineum]
MSLFWSSLVRLELERGYLILDTTRALQFQLRGIRRRLSWREFILGISSAGDFLGTAPSYTLIRYLMRIRLCIGAKKLVAVNILIVWLGHRDRDALVATAGTLEVAEDFQHIVDEGAPAVLAPIQFTSIPPHVADSQDYGKEDS